MDVHNLMKIVQTAFSSEGIKRTAKTHKDSQVPLKKLQLTRK